MSKGWIKLHRSMFDNDLWTAEPFTKGQAWIDLIGHANHRPASIWIRGIEVSVERGQLAWSELTMADRWKWSRGKVRRYLRMLQDRGMVVQQTNKVTTVLTICKYETYQTENATRETTNRTTGRTTDGQQTDNRRYTNKNVKNGENKDKDYVPPKGGTTEYSDEFERAWKSYPKRSGGNPKKAAYQKWQARLKDGVDPEDMIAGVERYAKHCKAEGKINTQYVMQGSTFFGTSEHYLESYGGGSGQRMMYWDDVSGEMRYR